MLSQTLCLILLAVFPGSVATPTDEAAFVEGLQQAQKQTQDGKWQEAHDELLQLILREGEQEFIKHRRREIQNQVMP